MRLLLPLLVQVSVAVYFSPTVFATQNKLLSKSTTVSQWDCDKECEGSAEYVAIIVDHKADHVVCGYLGRVVDYTICAKPANVYKKTDAGDASKKVGSLGNDQAGTWGIAIGQKAKDSAISGVRYPQTMVSHVYEGCEMHFLMRNKSTLVRTFTVRTYPPPDGLYTEYRDEIEYVEDAWGYCKE